VRGYVHCTAEAATKKKSKKELKQIELQNAQGEEKERSDFLLGTERKEDFE